MLFEIIAISQKLSHRKFSIFFIDASLDTLFDETIKTGASREMTSQKIRQYLTLTNKTHIPQLILLIKSSTKSKKYGSHTAHPTHILYQCAKCVDDRASINVICDMCDV